MRNKLSLNLLTLLFLTMWIAFSSTSLASKLPEESPELNQLKAMGYELHDQDKANTDLSVLTNGTTILNIEKHTNRTVVYRTFSRKQLSDKQEVELLRQVNQLNLKYGYQVYVEDGSLTFAIFIYGPYNAKTFATVIRLLETSNSILTNNEKLYQLMK